MVWPGNGFFPGTVCIGTLPRLYGSDWFVPLWESPTLSVYPNDLDNEKALRRIKGVSLAEIEL
jgi:hypothetical protein